MCQLDDLEKLFNLVDVDGSGFIDRNELHALLTDIDVDISEVGVRSGPACVSESLTVRCRRKRPSCSARLVPNTKLQMKRRM